MQNTRVQSDLGSFRNAGGAPPRHRSPVRAARRRWLAGVLACAAGLALSEGALAQTWPSRPLKLIAPFPPGGSTDVIARLIAQKLSDTLGQQMVVENRPGASGNIGHEAAAKAPPDGYTVLLTNSSTLTTNPHLFSKLPFDPVRDFAPVSLIATSGQVLVVHPSVPAKDVRELTALATSRPGTLNFGSGGKGIQSHISGEMYRSATGVNIVHVPYKGTVQAVSDLVAGQVQLVFSDMVPAMPHIKAGKLRPLAVTTARRLAVLPEVPTMIEAGVPGYTAEIWWAIAVPRGTPAPVIARINADLRKIATMDDYRERLTGLGVVAVASTPEEVSELVRTDTERFGKVLKDAGVQPE